MPGFDRRIWRTKPPQGTPLAGGPLRPNILAVPFNETAGLATILRDYANRYTGTIVNTTSATTQVQGRNGPQLQFNSVNNAVTWPNQNTLWGATLTRATIMMAFEKTDATLRASGAFGATLASDPGRIESHCPFSDGIVYWDFGGTSSGTNRLAVSGLTTSGYNIWCFTAGARGMEVWQNGRKVGSNAGTPTVTTDAAPLEFGRAVSSLADLVKTDFFYAWGTQLPEALIQQLTANPWMVWESYRPIIFGVTGAVTVNETFSGDASASAEFASAAEDLVGFTGAASATAEFDAGGTVIDATISGAASAAASFTATADANASVSLAAGAAAGFASEIGVPTTPGIVVVVTSGGSGYNTAPTVAVTGSGSGATAIAVLGTGAQDGEVVAVIITNAGTGYADPLTVTFDNTGTGGTGAAASASTTNVTSQQDAQTHLPFTVDADGYGQVVIEANPIPQDRESFGTLQPPPLIQPLLDPDALALATEPPKIVETLQDTHAARAWNSWWQHIYFALRFALGQSGAAALEFICPSVDETDAEWYGEASAVDDTADPVQITVDMVGESRFPMRIEVLAGGQDYGSAPTVEITGKGGTGAGASATAIVEGGSVTAITVDSSGYGYVEPISVSLTGGAGTGALAIAKAGRQWAAGDYLLWNDPTEVGDYRSYEIGRITQIDEGSSTQAVFHVERRAQGAAAGYAQYGSQKREHAGGTEVYRLINKSFLANPTAAGPQIYKYLWDSMTVCAVTASGLTGQPVTINLAPFVNTPGTDDPDPRVAPPSPGMRTMNGAAYTNLGVLGVLSEGVTSQARISVQAWESIRTVYGKVAIPPVGPTTFEGNAAACIVVYVCYISPPDDMGDRTVGLIDTLVIDEDAFNSYLDDDVPDGRMMPYHAYFPLSGTRYDWPPNRLPVCTDALDSGGELQLPITVDASETVLFHPDGQIDFIVAQVGTETAGSGLVVTVQT